MVNWSNKNLLFRLHFKLVGLLFRMYYMYCVNLNAMYLFLKVNGISQLMTDPGTIMGLLIM